jgi:preprotein translocase subunit SecE
MQFLREVRTELSKVVWPKWDEFEGSTIVMLFLVCAFAIYFFIIDLGLSQIAQYFLRLYGAY